MKTKNRKGKPLGGIRVECWGCGKTSQPCCRGRSLKDQGWYCEVLAECESVMEVYCKECIERYGPPSVWVRVGIVDAGGVLS